jgi:hypothetical protein
MQQVFLSYTYSPHPDYAEETADICRRVSTVIESMDLRVTTGEDLGGQGLSEEVKDRIEKADAMVALITPWKDGQGNKVAPPWVNDEFAHARARGKRAIRILHADLAASGMYAAHEYIAYSKDRPADMLLKLMKTLALWKKEGGRPMEVEIATNVPGQQLDLAKVKGCEFQLLRDYEESDWRKAKIWPAPGALYAYLPSVPDQAKLRLRLQLDTETWQSDYQSPIGRVQLSRRLP